MSEQNKDPIDRSGTVRPTKKALREAREARLTKSLRDNLARRKSQIRARKEITEKDDPEQSAS